MAPLAIPERLEPEPNVDLGIEGGVPGGVEGGVPGGVVGGIVGGLPTEAPAPPSLVRIGGKIKAPKLIHKVTPVYPFLAAQARIQGVVTVEAIVEGTGFVRSVNVVDGNPLLVDAAADAVKQWRYAPLLLNGVPTPFILRAMVVFTLRSES